MSQAAKEVTAGWNLKAFILIRMGLSARVEDGVYMCACGGRPDGYPRPEWIVVFTSLQIDGDTIYQMVGTCEPQTQEANFIDFIFFYL